MTVADSASFWRTEFLDQEIRGRRVEVQVDHRCDRTKRVVGSDDEVVSLGIERDLSHLRQAAHYADVGLENVDAAIPDQVAEFVLRVEALAGGQSERHLSAQVGHRPAVFHAQRLFHEEGPEFRQDIRKLEHPCQFPHGGVRVQTDIDVRSDSLPQRAEPGACVEQRGFPCHVSPVWAQRSGLESGETLVHHEFLARFQRVLQAIRPQLP